MKYRIQPWVVEQDDIEIMKDLLLFVDFYRTNNELLKILEWGAGYSTIYYPMFLRSLGIPFNWVAIEHDEKWYDRVTNWTRRYELVDSVLIDYNVLTQADLTKTSGNTLAKKRYIGNARQLVLGSMYDVIYIDGRLRNRCVKASLGLLPKSGRVIMDNANRKHYHKNLHLFDGKFIKPHIWVGQLK